jgi:hypothetical protein
MFVVWFEIYTAGVAAVFCHSTRLVWRGLLMALSLSKGSFLVVCPDRCCHSARTVIPLASMKTLTIKVPDSLFAEIASAAVTRKVPKSEIVRERLTQRSGGPKSVRISMWSQMQDLVIQSDSLPADLSTNRSHLKGYGKKRSH